MRPLQRFSVGAVGLLFLAGAALVFYLNAGTRVQIQVDGQKVTIATNARTVGAALAQAGISLDPADRVTPAVEAAVNPSVPIVVTRAPLLSLAADGKMMLLRGSFEAAGSLPAGLKLGPGDELLGDGVPLAGRLARSLMVQRAMDVTIADGPAAPRPARSAARTVGEALWSLGYQLNAGDQVAPSLDTPLSAGLVINVARSRAVTVQADGRALQVYARAATVKQVLDGLGLVLVGEDYSVPAEDQAIPANGQVKVVRVREEVLTDQQLIPFDINYQPLPDLEIDNLRLVQAGVPGVQRKLTRVRYEDGTEVARVAEVQARVQPPVPQILGYGTNIVIRTLDTPDGTLEYWRAYSMYATSYAAKFTDRTPGTSSYGRTASGKILTKGLVAIDRRLIPFGTRMYVPGYGFAEAADIGSGVKGRFIDLGFDDFNFENWHWPVTVYFLTPVPPADQIRWIIPNTVP